MEESFYRTFSILASVQLKAVLPVSDTKTMYLLLFSKK